MATIRGSLSLWEKVTCCVCETEIRKKNYKQHLLRHHSEEDSSDLRGKKQSSISTFFTQSKTPNNNNNVTTNEKNNNDDDNLLDMDSDRSENSDDENKESQSDNIEPILTPPPADDSQGSDHPDESEVETVSCSDRRQENSGTSNLLDELEEKIAGLKLQVIDLEEFIKKKPNDTSLTSNNSIRPVQVENGEITKNDPTNDHERIS